MAGSGASHPLRASGRKVSFPITQRAFGRRGGNWSSCPRPWKNAPCEVGAALCFPVVGSGVPADRLRAA
jgi:hypothetical protein